MNNSISTTLAQCSPSKLEVRQLLYRMYITGCSRTTFMYANLWRMWGARGAISEAFFKCLAENWDITVSLLARLSGCDRKTVRKHKDIWKEPEFYEHEESGSPDTPSKRAVNEGPQITNRSESEANEDRTLRDSESYQDVSGMGAPLVSHPHFCDSGGQRSDSAEIQGYLGASWQDWGSEDIELEQFEQAADIEEEKRQKTDIDISTMAENPSGTATTDGTVIEPSVEIEVLFSLSLSETKKITPEIEVEEWITTDGFLTGDEIIGGSEAAFATAIADYDPVATEVTLWRHFATKFWNGVEQGLQGIGFKGRKERNEGSKPVFRYRSARFRAGMGWNADCGAG